MSAAGWVVGLLTVVSVGGALAAVGFAVQARRAARWTAARRRP